MKKSFILFAALAALFSCTKETPVSPETPSQETYSVTLTAEAPKPGADTKTTLVDEGRLVHWTKGDAIKVVFFPNHTVSKTFTSPSAVFNSNFADESSASGIFKTENWAWGNIDISKDLTSKGLAVFPSSAVATSKKVNGAWNATDTEISFALPYEQEAIDGNIASDVNFSYAEVSRDAFRSAIDNNASMDLTFKNACAIVRIAMPAQLEKEVMSVTITSNSGKSLTGKGVVEMNYYKNEISSPFTITPEASSTSTSVTLLNSDGTPLVPGDVYYAVVWPGVHNDGLSITFNASDGSKATKNTGRVTLTSSKIKPYSFSTPLEFASKAPDYYYSDGSVGNDPAPSGKSVVGVIFYDKNPRENDGELGSKYTHGLVVSLTEYKKAWHNGDFPFTTDQLENAGLNSANGSVYGYTAFVRLFSMNYNLTLYSGRPNPVEGASVWYVPTNCEWNIIAKDLDSINEKIVAANGTAISLNKEYWTPQAMMKGYPFYMKLQSSGDSYVASMANGYNWHKYEFMIRPIFAF